MPSRDRYTRKTTNACLQCRRGKKKCDGKSPKCSTCAERSLECAYKEVRRRGRGKTQAYLQTLEAKVAELEDNIQCLVNLPSLSEDLKTHPGLNAIQGCCPCQDGSDIVLSDLRCSPSTEQPSKPKDPSMEIVGRLPARYAAAKHRPGDPGISPCSTSSSETGGNHHRAALPMNEKSFAAHLERWTAESSRPHADNSPYTIPVFIQLIPKSQAQDMFEVAFDEINYTIPLFDVPILTSLLEEHYADPDPSPGKNPPRWAMINIALAVAFQSRASSCSQSEMAKLSWAFFKNAFSMYPTIVLRGDGVLAVEALLAMAVFTQGTNDTRTNSTLVSASARLSLTIGLHQKSYYSHLDAVTANRCMRAFWMSYVLDKDVETSTGIPSIYDDSVTGLPYTDIIAVSPSSFDTSTDLPSLLFRSRVGLAVIISDIKMRLVNGLSRNESYPQVLGEVVELDRRLKVWKEGLPSSIHPDHVNWSKIPLAAKESILILYFVYYQALISTHNFAASLEPNGAISQAISSKDIQASAASQIIKMLHYLPPQQPGRLWHIIHYPISACITLLTLIFENPADALKFSYTRCISHVVTFLSQIERDKVLDVGPLLHLCREFENQAVSAVSKAGDHSNSCGASNYNASAALQERKQKIFIEVSRAKGSIQLAHGLLGNVSGLNTAAYKFLSCLDVDWQALSFPNCLVPPLLLPENYGFVFV